MKNMAKITYENKIALNENANIQDVNKCKASDLNEIKEVVNGNDDTVNEIEINLKGVQGEILWTNPKPDASISSNQTINLSNSSYDYLEIFYKQNTSLDICYSRKIPKGYSTRLGIDTTDGLAYRGLTRVNDAQYTINTISVNFTSSVKDSLVIPILIVGYKNS